MRELASVVLMAFNLRTDWNGLKAGDEAAADCLFNRENLPWLDDARNQPVDILGGVQPIREVRQFYPRQYFETSY
jgi:hypothetical protein